jgi:hypothetical protein
VDKGLGKKFAGKPMEKTDYRGKAIFLQGPFFASIITESVYFHILIIPS